MRDVRDELRQRFDVLARRAGLKGIPPAVVVAAGVCLILVIALALWHWWPTDSGEPIIESNRGAAVASAATKTAETAEASAEAADEAASETKEKGTIWVHVVGAVVSPGVYEVAAGSRVITAIEAAGGLSADAASAGVNLAAALSDGEQIVVPTQEEYRAPQASASAGGSSASSGPVNINTADAALLDTLPGVGPSTAQKIIADREANGPFKSTADLGRVSGFGDKKLAQLEGLICVR
ncbi:MAG: helix-hairpin-helix domain-containing protein [Coriobacteriia bacterium]